MTKLLIVDDSALMRRHMVNLFEREPGFEIATARNGAEALTLLAEFDPDVITLDINMPEMDGLTCLSRIMVDNPKPVVMVSSLTQEGAEATFEALNLGAVDFVHKPDGTISLDIHRIERELVLKVKAACSARVRRSRGLTTRIKDRRSTPAPSVPLKARAALAGQLPGLVLIGVSTGGPGTLEEILPLLPPTFPWPVVIAQHMPGSFTGVFAKRLATICKAPVMEVAQQTVLAPGSIYVAKGDADIIFSKTVLGMMAMPAPASSQHLWHPSVTRMVDSAMALLPPQQIVAVQLTGMGDDGAKSMTQLRARGGRTIAQDEASSIVFGMPGELVRMGGADIVLPASSIARQLMAWLPVVQSQSARAGANYGSR